MHTNELQNFLLEFSSFGGEPLYILMGGALEDGIASNSTEVIKCLFDLCKNGFLKCESGSSDGYIKQEDLDYAKLEEYIVMNEKNEYKEYPEEGEEYYFETTEEGEKIVPEDYFLPGWND